MPIEPTQLPRTSEAVVASELRAAIVRGDLAPGAKIRQEATAEQLGVSLIPLREALKTLAGEGIVTYLPQRGYFVTELPEAAIVAVYQSRAILESATEALAVPRLAAEDLLALHRHLDDQRVAAIRRDAVEMIATNRRFHFVIFDRCDNPWLLRFVTQLWDALDPYRVLSYRRMWMTTEADFVPSEMVAEHEEMVAALDRGDHAGALRLLELHRSRSETFLRALGDAAAVPEAAA